MRRLCLVCLALLTCQQAPASPLRWRELSPGVHYAVARLPAASAGGASLHVVRIDPRVASIRFVSASCSQSKPRTAGDWCRARALSVAINLGMYQEDYRSNVGYARGPACVNNKTWSRSYKSVLVFEPKRDGIPSAAILDLDQPGSRDRTDDYRCVVQNLRLLRGSGQHVWPQQARSWSEAAVAQDDRGNILFLFCRAPYTMRDFCSHILRQPLGIQRAMHVEGGPEASLSIHTAGLNVDLNGSYETGFREDDSEARQWPIPNVIGVARRR